MKIKYEIIWDGKPKKMQGDLAGEWFGVDYRVGKGWFITHIPTGSLLTDAKFSGKEDAVYFAELANKAYGELLARPDLSVLLDSRYAVECGDVFYALRGRIEDRESLVNRKDIDDSLTELLTVYQEQGISLIS